MKAGQENHKRKVNVIIFCFPMLERSELLRQQDSGATSGVPEWDTSVQQFDNRCATTLWLMFIAMDRLILNMQDDDNKQLTTQGGESSVGGGRQDESGANRSRRPAPVPGARERADLKTRLALVLIDLMTESNVVSHEAVSAKVKKIPEWNSAIVLQASVE